MSSEYSIRQELKHADLVISSVLIPGAKAPKTRHARHAERYGGQLDVVDVAHR